MTGPVRTAQIVENGESPFAVTMTVSGYVLKGDEPTDAGGGDTGPAPYDTLLAALGECTAMTVRWYAGQKEWPLDKVEVNLTHRVETDAATGQKTDVFEKQLILHGSLLSDDQIKKLHDVAAKCPVQKTLERGSRISTLPAPTLL